MPIWWKTQINERNMTALKTTSYIKSFLLLMMGQQAQLLSSSIRVQGEQEGNASKESKKAMPSQREGLSPAHCCILAAFWVALLQGAGFRGTPLKGTATLWPCWQAGAHLLPWLSRPKSFKVLPLLIIHGTPPGKGCRDSCWKQPRAHYCTRRKLVGCQLLVKPLPSLGCFTTVCQMFRELSPKQTKELLLTH